MAQLKSPTRRPAPPAPQPDRYRSIIGLATDWRVWRRRDAGLTDGDIKFFVGGAILECGVLIWSIDDVEATSGLWHLMLFRRLRG